MNEKGKEKKNGFSRNHEQKLALGAKKMCHRWLFSPLQKGQKERGERQVEGAKGLYFRIILTYLQE